MLGRVCMIAQQAAGTLSLNGAVVQQVVVENHSSNCPLEAHLAHDHAHGAGRIDSAPAVFDIWPRICGAPTWSECPFEAFSVCPGKFGLQIWLANVRFWPNLAILFGEFCVGETFISPNWRLSAISRSAQTVLCFNIHPTSSFIE